MAKKVAVVLSGSGVFDGAEIHEAVSVLIHLDRHGVEVECLAPNKAQHHVIDHLAGSPAEGERRNVLVESARIARGAVKDLGKASANDYDAVVLPGGFGAAKNLSDFAFKGADCSVDAELAGFLREAKAAGKVMCFICIAPAVAAAVFGADKPRLTIGDDPATAQALEQLGAVHVAAKVDEIVVDEAQKIVSTPAYMLGQSIGEVFGGIGKAIDATMERA